MESVAIYDKFHYNVGIGGIEMETKEKQTISEKKNIPQTKMQIDEAALQSIEPAAVLDSAIVPIRDFVSPEELHKDLIRIIHFYIAYLVISLFF